MSSSGISTEARKFLETTSIRGVPRIVKSKSKVLFSIWLVAVLMCAGVLAWQLTLVFIKYSKYPTNAMFVQAPNSQSPIFPDITVCNLCPLVHANEMSLDYNNYLNMLYHDDTFSYEKIRGYFETRHNKTITLEDYNYAVSYLVYPQFYFNNFPISKAFTINEDNNPTIACALYGWDYVFAGFCSDKMTAIWNADYYKCYKFRTNKLIKDKVRGLSGIFYVDTYLESQRIEFTYHLENSHSTGIRVAVHAPGTAPNMNLGMNINTGMESTITISQTQLSHLPAPYSGCTDQQTIGPLDETTTYSQDYCFDVCIQKQYIKPCGCIWGQRQFTQQQLIDVNYTMCGNLSVSQNDRAISWSGFYSMVCALDVWNNLQDESVCNKECRNPCLSYDYSTSISFADFPHISSQLSFYNTFIHNDSRFGTAFDDYNKLNGYMPSSNASELLQELDNERLIASSFLQLKIVFDSETFDIRKDTPAIPVEALGAQVGGILSLWLGVTVMLVFEVLEFLFTLVGMYCQSKSKRHSSVIEVQPADVKVNMQ